MDGEDIKQMQDIFGPQFSSITSKLDALSADIRSQDQRRSEQVKDLYELDRKRTEEAHVMEVALRQDITGIANAMRQSVTEAMNKFTDATRQLALVEQTATETKTTVDDLSKGITQNTLDIATIKTEDIVKANARASLAVWIGIGAALFGTFGAVALTKIIGG